MKKLSLIVAMAALLAANAFAQNPGPGEDQASKAKPATASEKAQAKSTRKTEGAKVAKSTKTDAEPGNATTAKHTTKTERKDASKARKSEGAKAAKAPKDAAGPN